MAGEIGGWVLAEACRDMKRWRDMDIAPPQVSVNLAPEQLDDPVFVESVMVELAQYSLPSACLAVEVPESVFLSLTPARTKALERLRERGVEVCLDRFGSGPASLHRWNPRWPAR